jgi:hypothetical protein
VNRAQRDAALAAIVHELSPERGAELLSCPDDSLLDEFAKIVADGDATAATAAEAWTRICELTDATLAGEIDTGEGDAIMVTVAVRHRDGTGAD